MTNYNERLEEILRDYADEHRNHAYEFDNKEISQYEYFESIRNDKEKAKQAITPLIKELVAEAKPEKQFDLGQVVYVEDTGGKRAIGRWVRYQQQFQIKNGTGSDYMDGYNAAIEQFEQNLLKALEEV